MQVELFADGLGWPEGPTALPDGRIVLVESYRSQLTAIDRNGRAERFAYVSGAPNACVLGSDGAALCLPERRHHRPVAGG